MIERHASPAFAAGTPMLRDARASDRAFFVALYASTRGAEMGLAAWPEEARRAFVQMQYDAQCADYQRRFPDSRCQVIESAGCPVGRLWIADDAGALRILDIALIPALQGRGIGSRCIRHVQRLARERSSSVDLHVYAGNPARRLYERLGFVAVNPPGGDVELYQAMTWMSRATPSARASQLRETPHEQA